ncbi:arginase family protein [Stella sp.]|uniref:arginase family protein n=1 Tax=Stella sp. TaxID=2912054 RepID=UPI0035B16021
MSRLFRPAPTFMDAPAADSAAGSRAVVIGMPFDCGTHPVRIGSRQGPAAIREQSRLLRAWDPDTDRNPLAELNVVDLGDATVTPSAVESSFAAIEAAVWHAVDAGAVPITMGGDGAVTLPQLRALHRKFPDLCVVHIDAHTDAYPIDGYNTATTFSRAVEEGVLDPSRSFHVGARGPTMVPGVFAHAEALGYGLVTMDRLMADGADAVFDRLRERIGGRPVYLCFDMDFFDPAAAPGVCTPAWGGASAREGLAILRRCGDFRLVACDVNTVSPPHDVGGMTAFLAATVLWHCLAMVADRERRPNAR